MNKSQVFKLYSSWLIEKDETKKYEGMVAYTHLNNTSVYYIQEMDKQEAQIEQERWRLNDTEYELLQICKENGFVLTVEEIEQILEIHDKEGFPLYLIIALIADKDSYTDTTPYYDEEMDSDWYYSQ